MSRFVLTAQLQLQAPNNVAQVVRQIQSQLNNVNVNVQVQGAQQAQRQIQQITQNTNNATTAAERMGRAFAVSVRRFAAFSIATRAVGLFTSTLSDAVQTAIDFERQLVKVSQVTGESLSKLSKLTSTITDLSTGLGVSSQSLLEVSTILLQAGLNSKDTEVALKSLARAALAPNFDSITETAEGAIAILAQFQEGVGSLEKQLGSINAVAGAFAVEASDLIDVIRRTGGVFKASGGDLNELLALFTSVRATTRESAESIGTGLRTIFTRIQRPQTIEFLKQFGVELVDLEGKFVGPFEAVKRLSGALAGLGEGDLTFIRVAEELGGFRQIGKVLPLLQQFSTAQAALNVAQKSGNSLAQDAATAQQALAIRITKVKEEFLALVRSITETATFQIMANTALSLATSLIKLADSIKPLLPLLGALAAVRVARGLGSFLGGIGGGLASARTFNKGGKVHHFARGGMVPGTGNRDTVPAMLSPGEFVIRKSSVQKLGAANLAAMNENRYAIGGKVGGIALAPVDSKQSGQGSVSVKDIISSLSTNSNLPGGISGNKRVFEGVESSKLAKNIIRQVGGFSSDSRKFTAEGYGFPSAKAEAQLQDNLDNALFDLITGAAKELGSSINIPVSASVSPQIIKSIGTADILGKVFEGSLNLLGAPFDSAQSKQDRDVFDFPSGLGPQLGSYFTSLSNIPTDAKRTLDKKILDDIASRKVKNLIAGQVNTNTEFIKLKQQKLDSFNIKKKHFGGLIQKFASGGGVGTDTVPALLTPGEFVVNRSAAQNIGYGALNRMNKVGRYAKGGVVQRFNRGGTAMPDASSRYGAGFIGSGGLDPSQNLIPFDMLARQASNLSNAQQAQATSTQNVTNAQNQNTDSITNFSQSIFASIGGLSAIQAAFTALTPVIDENSTATQRVTATLIGGLNNLVSTVGIAVIALQQMNVQITMATAKLVAQNALDFVSGTKSLTDMFDLLKGRLGGLNNILGRGRSLLNNNPVSRSINSVGNVANGPIGRSFGSLRAGIGVGMNQGIGATQLTRNIVGANGLSGRAGQLIGASGLPRAAGAIGGGISSGFSSVISNLNKLSGPALGLGIAFSAISSAIDAYSGYQEKANKAISEGNVEKAKSNSIEAAGADSINTLGSSIIGLSQFFGPFGLAAGVATASILKLGSELPVIGVGIKTTAIEIARLFGGNTSASIESMAAAQAQASKVQKDLTLSQELATKAMQRLENGTISASDAVAATSGAGTSIKDQVSINRKAIMDNEKNRSGGFSAGLREFGAYATFGYVDTASDRNKKIDEQNKQLETGNKKAQEALIQQSTPAINALSRQMALAGGSFEDVMAQIKKSNPGLSFALLSQGTNDLKESFNNIAKEVASAKKAFEALNLGLRGPEATASAASNALKNFADSLEAGSTPVIQSISTLEAAFSEAGQALDPKRVDAAIGNIANTLQSFGATDQSVNKFKENAKAFASVSANYNNIFQGVKNDIQADDYKNMTDDAFKKKFAKNVDDQLKKSGISDEVRGRFRDILNNVKLSDEDMKALRGGDFSVFQKYLDEAGQKTLETAKKIAEEQRAINEQLIDLTKSRIEAERNLYQAQKEAIDLRMEGREVQGKYGGVAVTNAERRNSILQRANVGAGSMGLSNLNNGNSAEFRRRNAEITRGFADVEARRRTENGLAGTSGVEAGATQQELKAAQKDQIQTIRDLIKVEEDELKLVQEKNKLEKQSLESLISGDIEKFFEQQAAVGATAAIATGNESLTNQFGASALASAFQDIQRQMEAGVQSIFGVRLAGAGGLGEMAAQAALSARGVQSPFAAQSLAGTTPEEEAARARLRDLGGALADSGQASIQMAEMELGTAQMNIDSATLILEDVKQRGINAASGFARGGMVYASRGMFVPRGTDTVPAMLTPGEFVVNRRATQNNLQLLKAINSGNNVSGSKPAYASRGGQIRGGTQYLANGGVATQSVSLDPKVVSSLTNALTTFNKDLATNVANLQNTKFQIKLETANINVNFQGASFLATLKDQIQKELFSQLAQELSRYRVGPGGNIVKSSTVLG